MVKNQLYCNKNVLKGMKLVPKPNLTIIVRGGPKNEFFNEIFLLFEL